MEVIAKYSDYVIQTIEFFKTAIAAELEWRDLKGLTNGMVDMINISKQHPIVTMMSNRLAGRDVEYSNILPAISVTPSNPVDIGWTLGKSYKAELVDDAFILILQNFAKLTDEEIQRELLITKTQISNIIVAYRRAVENTVKCQMHEWRKNEEIHVSLWTETPDMDILISNILDSVLSEIQMGFAGDQSKIRNMEFKTTKGLTNFNFGRVLFGTEYSLTFLNTYNNFTIFADDIINQVDLYATTTAPGE
ncbi:MAG: hypothetical protein WC389_21390 [Lutibacter sp.]|jgi:hypothetical protein